MAVAKFFDTAMPLLLLFLLSATFSVHSASVRQQKDDSGVGFTDEDLSSEDSLWRLYIGWLASHNHSVTARNGNAIGVVRRFQIFKDNVRYIHSANSKPESTYKLRLNKFAHLSNAEFRAMYTGSLLRRRNRVAGVADDFMYQNFSKVPKSVDWRKQGAVTAVKDQGSCGSCWAFSTVASVEGINQIRTKKLTALSEQELIDCDRSQNEGCNGGLMDYAFQFIVENGGISTEAEYPYTAEDGACDVLRKNSHAVVIDGYQDVPANSEESLEKAVANQPVSVAIEAGGLDFQFYWKGVFTGECGTDLDHGVTLVGYGESKEKGKYWIVKNSWGNDWGEDGFIRLKRGIGKAEGLCGINMEASFPLKTSPNPNLISPLSRKSGASFSK